MSNSRRDFFKKSALALVGTSALSSELLAVGLNAARKKGEITGIQLYSIRDDMKKDPMGTLKQLAAMGYKYVEHANYVDRKFYGYTAAEFRKVLDDLGLKMPSGHTVLSKSRHWDEAKKDFTDTWKYLVEDAATCGQKYVISPAIESGVRTNVDELKSVLAIFNKAGELCNKSGMKFGYHNHDFEFSTKFDNMTIYDIILTNTDPKLVAQQLDIGNMIGGGGEAMTILKKYPGRFELMHVKDEIKSDKGNEKYESTILGKGLIGTKSIVDWGRKSGGTTQFIIEQESYQGKTPIECVKEDLAIMKDWGY